jgi:hypothetical protein
MFLPMTVLTLGPADPTAAGSDVDFIAGSEREPLVSCGFANKSGP